MSLQMNREEREEFLAGLHVGIISIADPGRGPLSAPIWYDYEPGGELWIITAADSRKGRLLQTADRFSLVAQTEAPPYKYVSVEGPITSIRESDYEDDERRMASRYLGPEFGDRYLEATGGAAARKAATQLRVAMRPERWLTTDYAKQFPPGDQGPGTG
jgi:nitroimidazol reductase NimA-like FMN-containing flavoprotein (pyridoxamine 5'-phosphate oxidase superfamily)